MSQQPFRRGIVEGFFGRAWSWNARRDYAQFLASHDCNTYVYAPKSDAGLRKQWQLPFPRQHLEALGALCAHYGSHGLDFGIGLSPYELYLDFSPGNRELLKGKVDQINAIDPDTLCILFDDMMGDLQQLAAIQLAIVDFITTHSSARRFVVCPTYYSYDPLLVRYFGAQPDHYLEDLGRGLDSTIEIFWTGPKVISTEYPRAHLCEVAGKLGRKPLLWDNYPVNDAKRLTSFLHLKPPNRSIELKELTSGHLANPMNEAYLSQLPLLALASLYAGKPASFADTCNELCPPALSQALQQDVAKFQTIGLDALDPASKNELLRKYEGFKHPMAEEVCAWLQGEFTFDPACLT
jgi:hyaluronoglucosaminidase